MFSNSFLHPSHLVAGPLQCSSVILRIKFALAAVFHRFGLSLVPISCKCSSNGINLLMSRLIKFILLSLVHTSNVAPLTFPSLSLINSSITLFFHLFRGVISSSFISTMSLSSNYSASLYFLKLYICCSCSSQRYSLLNRFHKSLINFSK